MPLLPKRRRKARLDRQQRLTRAVSLLSTLARARSKGADADTIADLALAFNAKGKLYKTPLTNHARDEIVSWVQGKPEGACSGTAPVGEVSADALIALYLLREHPIVLKLGKRARNTLMRNAWHIAARVMHSGQDVFRMSTRTLAKGGACAQPTACWVLEVLNTTGFASPYSRCCGRQSVEHQKPGAGPPRCKYHPLVFQNPHIGVTLRYGSSYTIQIPHGMEAFAKKLVSLKSFSIRKGKHLCALSVFLTTSNLPSGLVLGLLHAITLRYLTDTS